jgi:hypothetical protein
MTTDAPLRRSKTVHLGPRVRRTSSPRALSSPSTDAVTPWLALCPRNATVLRDPDADSVRAVAPGTPLVLVTDRRWGRQRLQRTARHAGLVIEREVLLLPSSSHTIVSVDEDADAVRHFWRSVAMVPPGVTWPSPAVTAALRLASVVPWRWTGLVAGGHLLIGTRP